MASMAIALLPAGAVPVWSALVVVDATEATVTKYDHGKIQVRSSEYNSHDQATLHI
jgi:hypothetical protein